MARPPHPRPPLVGPLVGWELVRLARRGSAFTSRLIPPLVLLGVLTLFVWVWFYPAPLPDLLLGSARVLTTEQSARFGESFALVVLLALLGVALLVTPAYTCGGISDEKERRTLDFLLASDLSEREIVLGKFLARLILLLGVLAGGLPALAFCLFLGGVDPEFLLAGFAVILSTTVMMAAVSVAAACYAPDLRGALYRGYGLTAVIGCWPFILLIALHAIRGHPTQFAVVFLGAITASLVAAGHALRLGVMVIRRHRAGRSRRPAPPPPDGEEPIMRPRRWIEPPPLILPRPPIPNGDLVFHWKERHVRGLVLTRTEWTHSSTVIYGGLAVVGYVLLSMAGPLLGMLGAGNLVGFGQVVAGLGAMAGGVAMLILATGAGAAVSRERQRRTLESLLAIPVARSLILRAKASAVVERGWAWLYAFTAVVVVGIGALTADLSHYDGGRVVTNPLGQVWGLLSGVGVIAFLLAGMGLVFTAGLWMSVHATSPWWVVMRLLPVIGCVSVATAIAVAAYTPERGARLALVLFAAAGVMALAGGFCWRRAFRDFDRCEP